MGKAFIDAYEEPRFARLSRNLFAACFPLMKLLPARFMLDRAEADGVLRRGGQIVETTSGTFGLALAMLACVRDFRLTLVSSSSLLQEGLRRRLEDLGAKVDVTLDLEGSGDQQGRLELVRAFLSSNPGAFWPRQYDNPDNPRAYARLAEMIAREIGSVNCIVGAVGSGGSMCGTAHFLRVLDPTVKAIAVDTHRSVLFGHEAGSRLLRGLGNSIRPANLRHELFDDVHWVGALPAFRATRKLHRDEGIYVGPTSGAVSLVARWYAHHHPNEITVCIFPDEGHRYHDTVHDHDWVTRLAGWLEPQPVEPTELSIPSPASESEWTWMPWRRKPFAAATSGSPRIEPFDS